MEVSESADGGSGAEMIVSTSSKFPRQAADSAPSILNLAANRGLELSTWPTSFAQSS
jgi:hypothetical protein